MTPFAPRKWSRPPTASDIEKAATWLSGPGLSDANFTKIAEIAYRAAGLVIGLIVVSSFMAYRSVGRFRQASTPATIGRLLKLHHPFAAIALCREQIPAGTARQHRYEERDGSTQTLYRAETRHENRCRSPRCGNFCP